MNIAIEIRIKRHAEFSKLCQGWKCIYIEQTWRMLTDNRWMDGYILNVEKDVNKVRVICTANTVTRSTIQKKMKNVLWLLMATHSSYIIKAKNSPSNKGGLSHFNIIQTTAVGNIFPTAKFSKKMYYRCEIYVSHHSQANIRMYVHLTHGIKHTVQALATPVHIVDCNRGFFLLQVWMTRNRPTLCWTLLSISLRETKKKWMTSTNRTTTDPT